MIQIDVEMPKCCDECFALDDHGDYPYCMISHDQQGYTFNTREKRMPTCPLKAQEPRVMTYDELATFDGAFLIESPAMSQLDWVFFFDADTKSDAIWVEGFDGERCVVYREDYGTYLRCWTSRPTAEQREAIAWN